MVRKALQIPAIIQLLFFLSCLAAQVTVVWPRSTKGFPGRSRSGCRVQAKCTKPYMFRLADSETELKVCASLKLYERCLDKLWTSCRSAIYYHTVRTLVPVFMRDNKCGNVSLPKNESELWSIFTNPVPIGPKPTNKPKCARSGTGERYKSAQKWYCGLFGDPHLRTFYDEKQTCVVEGAWPLIDNKYLLVQVTNVPLVDGSSATATNKITVLIRERKKSCVQQKIYQAKSNALPAEFTDGTAETGSTNCPVKVVEIQKNSLIQIRLCHIGTDILVRQVSQYLTFHIRMPKRIANSRSTMGLCISGCPRREIIDYRELLSYTEARLAVVLPRKKITRQEAKQKCKDSNLTGFYLDSCLFDLLTTGDANFTSAAKSALDDAFLMDPIGTVRDIRNYNITVPRIGNPNTQGGGVNRKEKNTACSYLLTSTHGVIVVLFTMLLQRYQFGFNS